MADFREEMAERLKLLRGPQDRQEFAKILGMNYNQYTAYERAVKMPNAETLKQIAKALNCNINWLLTGEGDRYANHGCAERVAEAEAEYMDDLAELAKEFQTFADRFLSIINRKKRK